MRVYPDTIDTTQPLSGQGEYVATASVTVQGAYATVSGLLGRFGAEASSDLFNQLRNLDVKHVTWERHKNGEIIFKQKNIG